MSQPNPMNNTSGNVMVTRLEGPAPAAEIARDIAKRSVWIALPIVTLGYAFWGAAGAASAGYGLAVVVVNFVLAAWMLAVAGRISFAAMAGAGMFGYLIRLGLIFVAVMAVKGAPWVNVTALGATLIVTHLGLLIWELRHISNSLAYPGLKPGRGGVADSPEAPKSDPSIDQSASAA